MPTTMLWKCTAYCDTHRNSEAILVGERTLSASSMLWNQRNGRCLPVKHVMKVLQTMREGGGRREGGGEADIM